MCDAAAVQLMHEAAEPHAQEARALLIDYKSVTSLTTACAAGQSYREFCNALRAVLSRCHQQRYAVLCQVGLPHAFTAMLQSFEGRPVAAWGRRLRLACSAWHALADTHRGFQAACRSAELHLPAARLLKTVNLLRGTADALCSLLSSLLKGQRDGLLQDCHEAGCSTGLILHYSNSSAQQQLLACLVQNYAACRSLLRCSLRASGIVQDLCLSIESSAQEERARAVRSLSLLLDCDVVRCTQYMGQSTQDFARVLLLQVSGRTSRCGALQLLQCLLQPRSWSFAGQKKHRSSAKTDSAARVTAAWARHFGAAAFAVVSEALLQTCAHEAHTAGTVVLQVLLGTVVAPQQQGSSTVLQALLRSVGVLVQARDGASAVRALHALSFAVHSLQQDVDRAELQHQLQGWQRLATENHTAVAFVYAPVQQPAAERECTVCTLAYDEQQHVPLRLHCGHVFCAVCLHRWMHTSSTCPTCRDQGVNVLEKFVQQQQQDDRPPSRRHIFFDSC